MTNRERIIKYYEDLCNSLNASNYKVKGYDIPYRVDYEHPDLTMMTITDDPQAYTYLLNNGLINNKMCQFCGETPISNKYNFRSQNSPITLNICKNCHPQGKESSGGCLGLVFLLVTSGLTLFSIFINY